MDTMRLNSKAEKLRRTCVQSLGVGGKCDMDNILRNVRRGPNLYMFAPDSKMQEYLDLLYYCVVDSSGKVECKQRVPELKSQPDSGANDKQEVAPVPKGTKQKCSGSCYDLMECDINSDCLCTAPARGKSTIEFFLFRLSWVLTNISHTRPPVSEQFMGSAHLHVCCWGSSSYHGSSYCAKKVSWAMSSRRGWHQRTR